MTEPLMGRCLLAQKLSRRQQSPLYQRLRQADFIDVVFERPGAFQGDLAGFLRRGIVDLLAAQKFFGLRGAPRDRRDAADPLRKNSPCLSWTK